MTPDSSLIKLDQLCPLTYSGDKDYFTRSGPDSIHRSTVCTETIRMVVRHPSPQPNVGSERCITCNKRHQYFVIRSVYI
jgi:hypothetical protein